MDESMGGQSFQGEKESGHIHNIAPPVTRNDDEEDEGTEVDEEDDLSAPVQASSAQEDTLRCNSLREANRIHCRDTRNRKKEKEKLLKEELEVLTLCKTIVNSGPDLFSLHRMNETAPFSFLCENFYQRLKLMPEEMLGKPLVSIVHPRDAHLLQEVILHVLESGSTDRDDAKKNGDRGRGGGTTGAVVAAAREECITGGNSSSGSTSGSLIHLRLVSHGRLWQASMTVVMGTQGLIVVTRLYSTI